MKRTASPALLCLGSPALGHSPVSVGLAPASISARHSGAAWRFASWLWGARRKYAASGSVTG